MEAGGRRSRHALTSVKHSLSRASHTPWWGGPDGEQLMSIATESDGWHNEEARETLKLELVCRSKFKNLDPKTYPNPTEDP